MPTGLPRADCATCSCRSRSPTTAARGAPSTAPSRRGAPQRSDPTTARTAPTCARCEPGARTRCDAAGCCGRIASASCARPGTSGDRGTAVTPCRRRDSEPLLLAPARGLHGLGAAGIDLRPDDPPIPDAVDVSVPPVDLGPARTPPAVVAGHQKYSVAQVARFLDVEAVAGLERPKPIPEPLADGLTAGEGATLKEGLRVDDELDILRVKAHRALEVALVHGRELVEDDLAVLLGHGLSRASSTRPARRGRRAAPARRG